MFKRIISISALMLGLFSGASHAAFVPTDWQTQGDALATLDTNTGIEWLDLTQTFNLSFAQMNARLESDLTGWRYATYSEVVSLLSSFFDSDPVTWTTQFMPGADDSLAERTDWRNLFGTNDTAGGGISMGAVRYDESRTGEWQIFGPYHYGSDMTYVSSLTGGYAYAPQNGFTGYFIVSDGGSTLSSIQTPSLNANNPNAPVNQNAADVPLPAGIAAISLLTALFARRRTRNQSGNL